MQLKSARSLRFIAVLVAVALLLVWGLWPNPKWVEIAKVKRGDLTVVVEEEAYTRVVDRYTISAPVNGYLSRIPLDVGDSVGEGAAVASLKPMPAAALDARSRAATLADKEAAKAALDGSAESIESASTAYDLAQREFGRLEKLAQGRMISRQALDLARTEMIQAETRLRSARFTNLVAKYRLAAAEARLSGAGLIEGEALMVNTPVPGRVLALHRESAGTVVAGEPLLDVGDPTSLEVVAEVLSEDAVKITEETPVAFRRWGGADDLEGRVKRVEPRGFTKISALGVEEQRVLVLSEITSEPAQWQRLGDGFRVDAEFAIESHENVLIVPENALFRAGEQWLLYRVDGSRALETAVGVVARNGFEAAITGLEEGDTVIANPDTDVADGIRVRER